LYWPTQSRSRCERRASRTAWSLVSRGGPSLDAMCRAITALVLSRIVNDAKTVCSPLTSSAADHVPRSLSYTTSQWLPGLSRSSGATAESEEAIEITCCCVSLWAPACAALGASSSTITASSAALDT
jgi:hypothetical protein